MARLVTWTEERGRIHTIIAWGKRELRRSSESRYFDREESYTSIAGRLTFELSATIRLLSRDALRNFLPLARGAPIQGQTGDSSQHDALPRRGLVDAVPSLKSGARFRRRTEPLGVLAQRYI